LIDDSKKRKNLSALISISAAFSIMQITTRRKMIYQKAEKRSREAYNQRLFSLR